MTETESEAKVLASILLKMPTPYVEEGIFYYQDNQGNI